MAAVVGVEADPPAPWGEGWLCAPEVEGSEGKVMRKKMLPWLTGCHGTWKSHKLQFNALGMKRLTLTELAIRVITYLRLGHKRSMNLGAE